MAELESRLQATQQDGACADELQRSFHETQREAAQNAETAAETWAQADALRSQLEQQTSASAEALSGGSAARA